MANDQNIGITLTANSTGVEQALEKLARGLDKTIDKLNKMEKASADSSKAAAGGMEQAAGSALKFVGAITGVGSVVGGILAVANQLRREYDNLVSRQKGAADTQIGFEAQLAQTVRNAGGKLSGSDVRDMALRLAEGASADPAKAAMVLGSAFSARGVSNKQQAEEVRQSAEAAMKFAPEMSAEDTAMLAGTAIDIMKRTGGNARQAIGLTQLTSGLSRTTTLKGVAENVLPGALQMTELGGGSIETNAALMAALTQGIVDPEGAVSRTAGITFAKELRERMPNLGSTDERIKALQADPKLQKAFLEGGRFGKKQFSAAEIGRGQAQSSVESLIRGNGTAAESYAEFKSTIGDQALAGQTFDQMMAAVNSVTASSRMSRAFTGATAQQQITDTVGGQTSVTREGLKAFLKASGESQFSQDVDSLLFEGNSLGGKMPLDIASETLRKKAGRLRSPAPIGYAGGGGAGGSFQPIATEAELEQAKSYDRLAKAIESLAVDLKKNTDATQQNTKDQGPRTSTPIRPPSAALSK